MRNKVLTFADEKRKRNRIEHDKERRKDHHVPEDADKEQRMGRSGK